MDREKIPLIRELLEPLARLIEHSGTDFFNTPQEWITSFTGSVGATPAGIWINDRYETSIPGLYAIGDAASKAMQLGACVGVGGAGMLFALVSADDLGRSIEQEENRPEKISWTKEVQELETIWQSGNDSCDDTLYRLQEILFDLNCSFMKDENTLQSAVRQVREFMAESNQWNYENPHEYMKCWETRHMLENGLAFLTASLKRRETRGGHLRKDYPQQDSAYETCSVVYCDDQGELQVDWKKS
jgi:succinate dehydrogenase/fumarate reductase flavoprotein subunit